MSLESKNAAVVRTTAGTLQSHEKSTRVFNDVQSILFHDEWYSVEQRSLIYSLCLTYPHFTVKQRASIGPHPPRPYSLCVTDDECTVDGSASAFR